MLADQDGDQPGRSALPGSAGDPVAQAQQAVRRCCRQSRHCLSLARHQPISRCYEQALPLHVLACSDRAAETAWWEGSTRG